MPATTAVTSGSTQGSITPGTATPESSASHPSTAVSQSAARLTPSSGTCRRASSSTPAPSQAGRSSAEVLQDGDLVGMVPEIPGSEDFSDDQVADAIARADYSQPVGYERPQAPPPGPPLTGEGGVFRRFLEGFRWGSE